MLGTLLFDEALAVLGDSPTKYRFTALWTPDQVVEYNYISINIMVLEEWLKPKGKTPNLWG